MTNKIVGIVVAVTVAGAMLPTAIVQLSNATAYSGADEAVITLATVVAPMLAVIGIALLFLKGRR